MIRKLAVLAGAATLAASAATFTGVVTDTMCGARHTMNIKPDSKCVTDCVRMNPAKWKYALYDGREVYVLSDQATAAKYPAQKVKVTGTLDAKAMTIQVQSITPAK